MVTALGNWRGGRYAGPAIVDALGRGLASLFYFLMLVLPTVYQLERGALLAVLLAGLVCIALRGGWRLHRASVFWGCTAITASLGFVLNGVISGAPGALAVMSVFVVWPLVYIFFVGFFQTRAAVIRFERIIVLGAVVSAAMGLILVGGAILGDENGIAGSLLFQGAAVSIGSLGAIEYHLPNMATLIYAFPFLFALEVLPKDGGWSAGAWQWTVRFGLALTLLACIVSGRRAFWMVALLTPAVVIGLMWLGGRRPHLRSWAVFVAVAFALVLVIALAIDFDWRGAVRRFVSAFNAADDDAAGIRVFQLKALLSSWAERPILGHGAGAVVKEAIRDPTMPWAYELSYAALLFQTGIIGSVVYGGAVVWTFWAGLSVVREHPPASGVLLPLLAGLAGFLVANATNPYLLKFDYLWVIFMPLTAINAYRSELVRHSSSLATMGYSSVVTD